MAVIAALGRLLLSVCFVVVVSGIGAPTLIHAAAEVTLRTRGRIVRQLPERRIVLNGVPDDIVPRASNIWQCACDNDGCWPGCFTIASATLLKYWAERGYPNLWNGDENSTLQRLRELFPNLFCYNNVDDDGRVSDSGYDAADVARGFDLFVRERGYAFKVKATYEPAFEQIVEEIDAGRPVIGAFGSSAWGSHAGTIIGYDTTNGRRVMIVRPNLLNKPDAELTWGVGYGEFAVVTVAPASSAEDFGLERGPSLGIELVVDDSSAGFVAEGEWIAYPVGFANGSRFTMTTDPSNLGPTTDTAVARWRPTLPFDGLWEVLAWLPRDDAEGNSASQVAYRVIHAEGMSLVRRSQRAARPGWMSLGVYPFISGDRGAVELGNRTGELPPRRLWADAVKFVWRAPLIVRAEEGGPAGLVINGQRFTIPDQQTFEALRLSAAYVHTASPLALAQYGPGQLLPSVMSMWVGQYFNNTLLSPPGSLVRADSRISFRWDAEPPAPNMGARAFSVRWTRYLALSEGAYPFRVEAVGGVRLWLNNKLVLDAWDAPPDVLIAHEKMISVTAGIHRVDLEYVNREGRAQIRLGNLPPNTPIPIDDAPSPWRTSPEVLLRWADAGDPDSVSSEKPRRFFVTIWEAANRWHATSGWITETTWTVTLPADGRYYWSVLASDGLANSESSPPREIRLDRSPPWAQMIEALPPEAALAVTTSAPVDSYRLITDPAGNAVVVGAEPEAGNMALRSAGVGDWGELPVLYLRWSGKDAPYDPPEGLTYDVQARELMRMQTQYTLTVEEVAVPRISYELILSGAQEITAPVVLTEVVAITTVVPLTSFHPVSDSAWVLIATGLRETHMIFIGAPGSTYEFRVRATDAAGNAQKWYEGYSVQAMIDPRKRIYRAYVPIVAR